VVEEFQRRNRIIIRISLRWDLLGIYCYDGFDVARVGILVLMDYY
jgi:hypothetical protein